jgi:hypothetical protein
MRRSHSSSVSTGRIDPYVAYGIIDCLHMYYCSFVPVRQHSRFIAFLASRLAYPFITSQNHLSISCHL